jgi:hypothetical protein
MTMDECSLVIARGLLFKKFYPEQYIVVYLDKFKNRQQETINLMVPIDKKPKTSHDDAIALCDLKGKELTQVICD